MPTTYDAVRDQVFTIFRAIWEKQPTDPGIDIPPIQWDNTEDLVNPPESGWVRVLLRHGPSSQVTLTGDTGGRRFRRLGLITIQVFAPVGEGMTDSDRFVKIILDAFEGGNTGADKILFRNVRANEIGRDGPWFQTNVLIEFEYDEVK